MNEASLWRYKIAEKLAESYANNPAIGLVMLGGSTARGHADPYSDLEIGVFWHRPPQEEERQAVVDDLNADLVRLYPYYPDEKASFDAFYIGRDQSDQPQSGKISMR